MIARRTHHLSLVAALSLAILAVISTNAETARLIFSETAEGGLTMTGNTVGLSHAAGLNCPGTHDAIGTFIALDPTSVDLSPAGCAHGSWPLGTTSRWQDNGSSGYLELPHSAVVLRGELIWSGSWRYGGDNVFDHLNSAVLLRAESGAEINVIPSVETAVTLDQPSVSGWQVRYYTRSADVTDFIQTHGEGFYTVGGIPATQDHTSSAVNAGGWLLVVAYEDNRNKVSPQRNLSIFVGADWVDDMQQEDYTVSGFCTPPTGPFSGRVLFGAVEGDANREGNQIHIGRPGSADFVPLYAPNNPVNNFFSSQINDINGELDRRGSFGDFNHDPFAGTNIVAGRQGWDITGLQVFSDDHEDNLEGVRHLINGQTAATIRAISGAAADSYAMVMVALEIDINAPSFYVGWSSLVLNNNSLYEDSAEVGDLLTYFVFLDNWGTADAESIQFTMPLPEGLVLRSFEIEGLEGDANGNPVTAAQLTSGVNVGTVGWNEDLLLAIEVEVIEVPSSPAPARFETQAGWSYEFVSCVGEPPMSSVAWSDRLVMPAPRLESSVSAQPAAPYYPGDTITINVNVANTGLAETRAALVEVEIPEGVLYVAGSTTVHGTPLADHAGSMPFVGGARVNSLGQSPGVVTPSDTVSITFRLRVEDDPPYLPTIVVASDTDGDGPAPARITRFGIVVEDPLAVCGNGILEGSEECDDGNLVSGDGCSATCQVEPGWDCEGEPSECDRLPVCGNGIIEEGEQCDDGNTMNGDGCSAACQVEPGWDCEGEPSECDRLPVCGNGIIEEGEQCDDGNTYGGDGCSATCQVEPGWDCEGEPSECDRLPVCGNGLIEEGEQCDDGNTMSGDGCSSTCRIEDGWECSGEPSTCQPHDPTIPGDPQDPNATIVGQEACGCSSAGGDQPLSLFFMALIGLFVLIRRRGTQLAD